jgi:ubiquinone/menaquinone biosynthesis C-methylase UbiE
MSTGSPASQYALGSTGAEHERLMRQGAYLASFTEGFFRDAGIGSGLRVLDIGSGVGDVAMLVARMAGPSGSVVGVERDAVSIGRARARAAEAGLDNVSFTESDVSQISSDGPFDAVVGRFILMFLPDPVAVLRTLSHVVRPGGVVAFQEPSWVPFFQLSAHLPLWTACASLAHQALGRAGANPEMGPALYRAFQEAGLPAPKVHMELPLGDDPDIVRWIYDFFCSLLPQIRKLNLPLDRLGNLDTLLERIQAEVMASKNPVPFVALFGARCRRPPNLTSS